MSCIVRIGPRSSMPSRVTRHREDTSGAVAEGSASLRLGRVAGRGELLLKLYTRFPARQRSVNGAPVTKLYIHYSSGPRWPGESYASRLLPVPYIALPMAPASRGLRAPKQ